MGAAGASASSDARGRRGLGSERLDGVITLPRREGEAPRRASGAPPALPPRPPARGRYLLRTGSAGDGRRRPPRPCRGGAGLGRPGSWACTGTGGPSLEDGDRGGVGAGPVREEGVGGAVPSSEDECGSGSLLKPLRPLRRVSGSVSGKNTRAQAPRHPWSWGGKAEWEWGPEDLVLNVGVSSCPSLPVSSLPLK